jgi:zinc/manganese transport system substrate-binding protein
MYNGAPALFGRREMLPLTNNSTSRRWPHLLPSVLAGSSLLLAGCAGSTASPAVSSPGKLPVVAAENFWGSIASQLGGSKVAVSSIIVNPNTDPHSYEATASDGAAIARSRMAIVNGIGYDSWASKLIAANPASGRVVLDAGKLLRLGEGDNPHQWYSPSSVQRVIAQIVLDYERLDPKDASYFEQRRTVFEGRELAEYNSLRSAIRARYGGVAVGYSESIFQPLGEDLGLRLLTPYSFAKAIAEGVDVSAADKQTVDRQAEERSIKVWVYNSQNATPDVQRVNQLARAAHIPITTITETLSPPSDTFEQWQAAQLTSLRAALHRATGR